MEQDSVRVPDGTGLSSPTEPQEGLGPTGFDPSRSAICDLQDVLHRKQSVIASALDAAKALEWLGKYGSEALRESGYAKSVEGADEANKYTLRAMSELSDNINGYAMALAEADVEAAFSDSDGSPKGGDGEAGSVRSKTARAEGVAQPLGSTLTPTESA